MSGELTELGTMSIGGAVPLLGLAGAQLTTSATLGLGEIQAKLTGLLNVQLALLTPQIPTLAIAGAAQALLSLEASLSVPFPTPQVLGVAAAILELQATLLEVQAQLAFAIGLGDLLAAAGLTVYRYSGTANSFGSEVSAHTSTGIAGGVGTDHVEAVILATSVPATAAALAQVFA